MMLKSSNTHIFQEMLRIYNISFLRFPFCCWLPHVAKPCQKFSDVQCAVVLPGNFSDSYCIGAAY